MKKYFFPVLLALITGFFLCTIFINEYEDYEGIQVSYNGEKLFFIQSGVYSSIESMEENTMNLENYIYNEKDGLYYVYIGITYDQKVKNKIMEYYKEKGINTISKEFTISNKNFINKVKEYDNLIINSQDSIYISSLINQTLISYEEEV